MTDPSAPHASGESRATRPRQKALAVNLDPLRYGTFAEIGAGQEVVRWFFQAGGAAGTIAKSISAYDMQVSDAIYGQCERYVCRERLEAMLDYEYELNLERLREQRGDETAFFAFADTVAAQGFKRKSECHGWMGVKFQGHPGDEASRILMHVRMRDLEALGQQEALGIVGTNLIYGAFFLHHEPDPLIESLLDGLSTDRIEVDMIEFSGAEFGDVDNRVMTLRLVQLGLTGAAMFAADGSVLQPYEVLRKRSVLVERGSFRPPTLVNADLLRAAHELFAEEVGDEEPLVLAEITMSNLRVEGDVDLHDFLARADMLAATGVTVLISDYPQYYKLGAYLSQYTQKRVGLVMGAKNLGQLFDEQFYTDLEGGVLESFGRLFKNDLKLYVYPFREPETDQIVKIEELDLPATIRNLYEYLLARDCIEWLDNANHDLLHIFSRDVLRKIGEGDPSWEEGVSKHVAAVIKQRKLFGYDG